MVNYAYRVIMTIFINRNKYNNRKLKKKVKSTEELPPPESGFYAQLSQCYINEEMGPDY